MNPLGSLRALIALIALIDEVREDHRVMRLYDHKYGGRADSPLVSDLVSRIGLQMIASYRLMHALAGSGARLPAKITSRAIRLVYGSDIHWNARLAPGVLIVHGMGMAISGEASVGPRSILFQNVTLGMGIDPVTRRSGAPQVEEDVHIGPGATLLGPITIGAGSKIMAGAVVTHSIPRGSIVEAPVPRILPRTRVGRSREEGPS